jgi:uncharacterized membrane protein YesL
MTDVRHPESPSIFDVIWLSCKQLFKRLPFWIRPNFWYILVSLPIITMPGAYTALNATVAAGLRDPGESRVVVRKTFKDAFFKHFGKSLALGFSNLFLFAVIAFSIYFWVGQSEHTLNFISIIAFYFLAMWSLCQPFLFPILISKEGYSILHIFKDALLIVIRHPLIAFAIALTNLFLNVTGIILMGPILLIVPAFISIISIQVYWLIERQPIPEWMEPEELQKMIAEDEAKQSGR